MFKASEEARKVYPEDQWFIEGWNPPVMAWYTIQDEAYEKNLIKDGWIGDCKCRLLKVKEVISLYEKELQTNPFGLYGLKEKF